MACCSFPTLKPYDLITKSMNIHGGSEVHIPDGTSIKNSVSSNQDFTLGRPLIIGGTFHLVNKLVLEGGTYENLSPLNLQFSLIFRNGSIPNLTPRVLL